jgi:beta-galactosidase
VYQTLFDLNLDCNLISLGDFKKDYKLIFVPGHCVMDENSAENIRRYVQNGGTVVMTAYSAKVNENNTVFDTPLPGRLSDVFGIRIGGFERTKAHAASTNEGGLQKVSMDLKRENIRILFNDKILDTEVDYYEIIEPGATEILSWFTNTNKKLPAITVNNYGKGRAIYLAVPADRTLLQALMEELYAELDIKKGPVTPQGVSARYLDEKRTLYVNTTPSQQTVKVSCLVKGLISNKVFSEAIELAPYEVDLIEKVII